MTEPPPELARLLTAHGANAARPHLVLGALSTGAWTDADTLVRDTTVAHRTVTAVLDALGPELEHADDRLRLREPARYTGFDRPRLADPVAHLLDGRATERAEIAALVAGAPAPRTDLDHVTAAPETALRRALLMATRFTLPGHRLLCVGDHDLTSLATALVCPEVEVTVVDIDERMLEYIGAAADRLGLRVRCHFTDLRLGLPAAVVGGADLVFTDPPYTPDGVELFVRCGLAGLADPGNGRVLLAYGASETTPGLVARTQNRLTKLNLATEAMWPDFNRYLRAPAIGGASDLYLLRPTARTPRNRPGGSGARVYSQGANAKEARGALAAEPAAAVLARSGAETLVGAWPGLPDSAAKRWVDLADWLGGPAADAVGSAVSAAVDLTGGWSALLGRALLASPAERTHAVVGSNAPEVRDEAGQDGLRALLGPGVDVRFLRGFPDAGHTVVALARGPLDPVEEPAAWLRRFCRDRPGEVLTGVLRAGLIALAAHLGRPVNKKYARTAVAAALPWAAGHTLLDVPLHRFAAVDDAVAAMAGEL